MSRLVALTVALVLALSACGVVPQPFRHEAEAGPNNPLLKPDSALGIVVLPPRTLDPGTGALLAKGMAEALTAAEIPTVVGTPEEVSGRLVMTALVTTQPADGNLIAVSLDWVLFDETGTEVARHAAETKVDKRLWARSSAADMKRIAVPAAAYFAGLVNENPGPVGQPGDGDAPLIVFSPVEGTTRINGNLLRNSVMVVLRGLGAKVVGEELVAEGDVPTAVVKGRVDGRPRGDGEVEMTVIWTVEAGDGREVGKVELANPVARRAFEGYWGNMARDIAAGSVEGIAQILNRSGL